MRIIAAGIIATFAFVLLLGEYHAGEGKKPKYTIKEVMKKAHKSGLIKKVASGKASKEEKEELRDMYKSLAQNKPPKGDLKAWAKRTAQLVKLATQAVSAEGPVKGLTAAASCAKCHKEHK